MKLLDDIDKYYSPPKREEENSTIVLPRDPAFTASTIKYVASKAEMEAVIDLAYQLPLAAISFHFIYDYCASPLMLRNGKKKDDVRAILPLLLSVSMIEYEGEALRHHNVVCNLVETAVVDELQPLLNLPVTYVAHQAKTDLFCLWQLGLDESAVIWDTNIAERALNLGIHQLDRKQHYDDISQEIAAHEQYKHEDAMRYGMLAVTQRYGIEHRFATSKAAVDLSFNHCSDGQFSEQQIHYAAEEAISAARVYFKQLQTTSLQGCLQHLIEIEMPWVVTNAAMEWKGVRVDRKLSQRVLDACQPKMESIASQLADMGLTNPNSPVEKEAFFANLGLLPLFRKGCGYSFDLKQLRKVRTEHPAIDLLAKYSNIQAIQRDALLQPGWVGLDGRVHPEHKQLEVVTGRQSCSRPNLMGLHGKLRPVVLPAEGYGIAEVDLAQVEIGITAAVYRDTNLITMFNQGDIYTAMAQQFYRKELPPEHRDCDAELFKQHHREKRHVMKQCTLGIIYGLTAHGLSARLNVSKAKAQKLMDAFLGMFPTLVKMMDTGPQYGAIRGYVTTSTGLSRHRKHNADMSFSERNWMINMPVQGTAVALFKIAGNRLRQLYKQYDAYLIVALHDAFIFEAPFEHIKAVSNLTGDVMIQVLQEHFPKLKPRIDINDDFPHCWNKDGDPESITQWIEAS